jgi:hypothetical protein
VLFVPAVDAVARRSIAANAFAFSDRDGDADLYADAYTH